MNVNDIDSISPAKVELGTGTSEDGSTRCSCSSHHASIINGFQINKSKLRMFLLSIYLGLIKFVFSKTLFYLFIYLVC